MPRAVAGLVAPERHPAFGGGAFRHSTPWPCGAHASTILRSGGVGGRVFSRVTSRLDLEYDGSGFYGWARQAGQRTVQAEVEAALGRILQREVPLTVAGRTDRGVHATGQVASYEGPALRAEALNALLPPDVAVRACAEAPDGFDARKDALSRSYRYRVLAQPRAVGVRGRAGALLAAPPGPRPAARLRGAAARQARLHGVHADRDLPHALHPQPARRALGRGRRRARVRDRGRLVHAPHEPRARGHDAPGRAAAGARSRTSRRCSTARTAATRARPRRRTASTSPACATSDRDRRARPCS